MTLDSGQGGATCAGTSPWPYAYASMTTRNRLVRRTPKLDTAAPCIVNSLPTNAGRFGTGSESAIVPVAVGTEITPTELACRRSRNSVPAGVCTGARTRLYAESHPNVWARHIVMSQLAAVIVATLDLSDPDVARARLAEARELIVTAAEMFAKNPRLVLATGDGIDLRAESARHAVALFEAWARLGPDAVHDEQAGVWRVRAAERHHGLTRVSWCIGNSGPGD